MMRDVMRRLRRANRPREQKRHPFGDWQIPRDVRVVEWKHLTDTIRDENDQANQ